eukprot:GILJ01005147.1.p1 GENE.GILJ01005147.1~~GILJ01005147.1.p1  ORF type:complete len:516 (+),score=87.81 GILJ01005147.1:492-2039(+)
MAASRCILLLLVCYVALSQGLPTRPVVLVPGVGGTILNFRDNNLQTSGRLWVTMRGQDQLFSQYLWGKYDKDLDVMKPYYDHVEVTIPTENFGLAAISNLDPDADWPVSTYTAYFERLINRLKTFGYVPGKTLFAAPYDWRQSNACEENLHRLRTAIETAFNATQKKVSLISHSMGGLLVRSYLHKYNDEFNRYVEQWATVATPFQGAGGKVLNEFLTGYNLGNRLLKPETARALCINSPPVYELLPNPLFNWSTAPYVKGCVNGTDFNIDAVTGGGRDLAKLFSLSLRNYTVKHMSDEIAQPFNDLLFDLQLQRKQQWDTVKVSENIRFLNIYSKGKPTPIGVEFQKGVQSYQDLLFASVKYILGDGDETVPVESAAGDRFGDSSNIHRVAVSCEHQGCVNAEDVIHYILCFESEGCVLPDFIKQYQLQQQQRSQQRSQQDGGEEDVAATLLSALFTNNDSDNGRTGNDNGVSTADEEVQQTEAIAEAATFFGKFLRGLSNTDGDSNRPIVSDA